MSSPFNNDHPSCQQPTACRRSTIASALCQPCHFRKRRVEARWPNKETAAITTEEDDDGVINVLQSVISQTYPNPEQIGHGYITAAIEHIREMRKEIIALRQEKP